MAVSDHEGRHLCREAMVDDDIAVTSLIEHTDGYAVAKGGIICGAYYAHIAHTAHGAYTHWAIKRDIVYIVGCEILRHLYLAPVA